jgi:hypothetical protein
MGFFLLRRDGDVVTLIAPTVFGSRQEALDEVTRVSSEGVLDADEIFVIDLDAATPVIILAPPSPPVESEIPTAEEPDIEESPLTGAAPDEDAAAEIAAAPIVEVEEAIAAAVLADAEESLPLQPQDEESPAEEPEAPEPGSAPIESEEIEPPMELERAEDADETPEPVTEESGAQDEQPESSGDPEPEPEPEPAAQAWPWEAVPAPSENADLVAVTPVETDEATAEEGGDEVADDQAAAEDESAGEAEPVGEEPQDADVEESVEGENADALPEEVSGLLADLEELAPTPSDADDEEQPSETEGETEASEPEDESAVPKAYEAGGSDITTLTCDDCIYLNTCPKKGESDPTSCGSFQWRTV